MTQIAHQMIAQNAVKEAQRALEAAEERGDAGAVSQAKVTLAEAEFDLVVAQADAYKR